MVEASPETEAHFTEYAIEEFLVRDEPYYRPIGDEIELFTAAYRQHIPVLLKGPTGCGKTRFVEYMAWQLGRPLAVVKERAQKMSLKKARFVYHWSPLLATKTLRPVTWWGVIYWMQMALVGLMAP